MTAFTDFPNAFILARTLLALSIFCFLPGYMLALARAGAKRFNELLLNSPAETILESIALSLLLLAFSVLLLMFSIGFSALALLALELALLGGAWWYWRRETK